LVNILDGPETSNEGPHVADMFVDSCAAKTADISERVA